jgi:hypothetical protein
MKEDQREQSEQSYEQVKFCKRDRWVFDADYCSFFQENKSYGIKKPFALILCLPIAKHHIANINLYWGTLVNLFFNFENLTSFSSFL